MLAKVYSNALMTSLNSRSISDRARADLEPGGAASQQYSQYSSYSNPPGRRTMERQDPLRSFTTNGAVVTNGPPTVVHISTDREVEYNYDEDDLKSNVVRTVKIVYQSNIKLIKTLLRYTGAGPTNRRIPHVTNVK